MDARLALALGEGGLVLPEQGVIAALSPQVANKRGLLDRLNLEIIEGFAPEVASWRAVGAEPLQEAAGPYSAVILSLPRAKSEARSAIALAMTLTDGPVVIDGQKTDGIDSILKEVRARIAISGPVNKAHGKLFWCPEPDADIFADWAAGPELTPGGFWTAPGVFSADGVDPGSALLVEALPADLGKQVADFGAGWGFLSAHILARKSIETLHLVEAEHLALECAKRNVTDPRAEFHWADVVNWPVPSKLDAIVMNPPFHSGRRTDIALGGSFVEAAAAALSRHGRLWMVANRHLPYEKTLRGHFADVRELGGDARYKLFRAEKPLRAARQKA